MADLTLELKKDEYRLARSNYKDKCVELTVKFSTHVLKETIYNLHSIYTDKLFSSISDLSQMRRRSTHIQQSTGCRDDRVSRRAHEYRQQNNEKTVGSDLQGNRHDVDPDSNRSYDCQTGPKKTV